MQNLILLPEKPHFAPFIIVGSVLCVFGVMVILFSIEVCIRLDKNVRRVMDPEVDAVGNLHNVKHWVPPGSSRPNADRVFLIDYLSTGRQVKEHFA
jgi:hypothetical protein